MLPGRLGLRFALEALFLVLLAIGAGLADLRPALIVLVMAVAWVLVALIEFTAERITASPISYLLPSAPEPAEDEHERVFWPPPEERTVVAPPEAPAAEPPVRESGPVEGVPGEPGGSPEEAPSREAEARREPEPGPEPEPQPEPVAEGVEETGSFEPPRRRRSFLRRREREVEPSPVPPPRHVKLLPRRSAPEPSRAAQEVADLFGSDQEDAPEKRKERGA